MIKLKILALLIFLLATAVVAQTEKPLTPEEEQKVESLFNAANDLMDQKKFAEALQKYKEALAIAPDTPGLLYNGGIAAFETKDYTLAAALWSKLKEFEKNDGQVRAKLVQTYQAAGKIAERDKERAELFELQKSGKIEGLSNNDFYVREQFETSGQKLMVMEHFELKGSRALRYVFFILDKEGEIAFRISLGSYETTNAVWRQVEKRGADERLFHLDGYFPNGSHATYGMFTKEPTYEETRQMVVNILAKKQNPISATIVSTPESKKEEKKP